MFRLSLITLAAALGMTPAVAQDRAGVARNGPVEIAYWTLGPTDGMPLVLINGQGAATRTSGNDLSLSLAAEGFRVILFDNRDSGQSTVLTDAGAPPEIDDIIAALATGSRPEVAYDLSDMAGDTLAVMDAAGVRQAHVLGHSLGGMIAQVLAARHPDRVLSLISASSTTGDPALPFGPAMMAMNDLPAQLEGSPADQQAQIYRIFEGEAVLPMRDDEIADRVAADSAAPDPNAAARQGAAAVASGDRRDLLRGIQRPALVLHGGADPWFPPIHAESTSAALGGAPIRIIDGMGHIISDAAAPIVAKQIADFVRALPR